MTLPIGIAGQLADAFDVPVFVRRSSLLTPWSRPRRKVIDAANAEWPTIGDIPPEGAYLVHTTWRDVIDAAMTVGRDPTPWLASVPGLAKAELVTRYAPLFAYLQRARHGAGQFLVEPNVVYQSGAEATARGAFAYRIGMTMAEWTCRKLMGLGPTLHAETEVPPEAGWKWSNNNGKPDLVGYHWHTPHTWLVEAKGSRNNVYRLLSKGAGQLSAPGLMEGPHTRVLCGTSLEHRLFVTANIEVIDERSVRYRPEAEADEASERDDAELLALARSRMLSYYALRALAPSSFSVRPVGGTVAAALGSRLRQSTSLVTPLETDAGTREERLLARDPGAYARARPLAERLDMLTGRVPGTDIVLGMSRRLFAACQNLAAEEDRIRDGLYADYPEFQVGEIRGIGPAVPDATLEMQAQRRWAYGERQTEERDILRHATRQGYDRGRESSWNQLLDNFEPQLIAEPPDGLLEGATTDTYLALDSATATAFAGD